MKKKLSTIGLVLVFTLGFLILMYPTISNYYNKMVGSYSIGEYDDEISKTDTVDLDKILKNAKKYNEELLKAQSKIKIGESKDKNYLSQLKIKEDESIIGSIIIDKINVKIPIYHGTSQPVLQKGVGHLEGTTLPIGGEGTHSVLTGHTGIPSSKLFTDLEKLEKDDLIVIKVLDKTLTYKVTNKEVVLPKEVNNLRPVQGKDLLTLVTCTPYGVNSHRLLVHSQRTENVTNYKTSYNKTIKNEKLFWNKFSIVVCIVFIVVIIHCLFRKYKIK